MNRRNYLAGVASLITIPKLVDGGKEPTDCSESDGPITAEITNKFTGTDTESGREMGAIKVTLTAPKSHDSDDLVRIIVRYKDCNGRLIHTESISIDEFEDIDGAYVHRVTDILPAYVIDRIQTIDTTPMLEG